MHMIKIYCAATKIDRRRILRNSFALKVCFRKIFAQNVVVVVVAIVAVIAVVVVVVVVVVVAVVHSNVWCNSLKTATLHFVRASTPLTDTLRAQLLAFRLLDVDVEMSAHIQTGPVDVVGWWDLRSSTVEVKDLVYI